MSHRRTAAALTAAVLTLAPAAALTGCSQKDREYGRDAPVGSHDDSPADVINMPDGFSNIAAKCDGPNRVYVIFHAGKGGSVAVAPNDPRCKR